MCIRDRLPCVPFMQIFCITSMFYPIHTANLNAIKALGRSDYFLKLEIIKKIRCTGKALEIIKKMARNAIPETQHLMTLAIIFPMTIALEEYLSLIHI